uniref:RecF/RecN/SMC N-terminal domain-containing protein n=1 Tax=Panagrolaimus davidi TaxID=227884 RepID=A0A914R2C9_9BILA
MILNLVQIESLFELSGGQKSLVTLSLILSLLRFKPAPLYILDKIDAALDISHTSNIGVLIRKNFINAQFIVVSLKPGMFKNVIAIFRTRLADDVSSIIRVQDDIVENFEKEN